MFFNKRQVCIFILKYSPLGCPRNNQFFFWFEPKRTESQSVSVVFWFVSRNQINFFSVCFGVSVRYRNNRNKPEQTEKISKKQNYITVSSKQLILFSVRTKTNRNSTCFGCFSFLFFSRNQTNFFSVCFGVFCLFRLFRNTETLCFDIKAKQPKQTSCFG
jgi:hypothetical protein